MLVPVFTFANFVIPQLLLFWKLRRKYSWNKFLRRGWPLMGRHRAASSNYSLCSQAFAALHSLFVSFSFFIHFREPAPPFLPPASRSGFVFFRPRPRSPSFFPPILLHFCSQLFVFLHSWFSRMVCSFSLFSSLPSFRLRFTVFHCRDHIFGWFSSLSGTFLSGRIAISVNFGKEKEQPVRQIRITI